MYLTLFCVYLCVQQAAHMETTVITKQHLADQSVHCNVFILGFFKLENNKQESPPTWTQEAYCPQCSKYSLYCSFLGGTPSLARGVPHEGYPSPIWDWGTPRKEPVTSHWGTPKKGHRTNGSIMGWRWGTPQKGHGTSGSIMGWRWGTPLVVDRQTPVQTVPSHPTDAGGNDPGFPNLIHLQWWRNWYVSCCILHRFYVSQWLPDSP